MNGGDIMIWIMAAILSAVLDAGAAWVVVEQDNPSLGKTPMECAAMSRAELKKLGFTVLDSKTNFLFAKSDAVSGKTLYEGLKERGVLVRRFDVERIKDYVRVTIGTKEQMDVFLQKTAEIIRGK